MPSTLKAHLGGPFGSNKVSRGRRVRDEVRMIMALGEIINVICLDKLCLRRPSQPGKGTRYE